MAKRAKKEAIEAAEVEPVKVPCQACRKAHQAGGLCAVYWTAGTGTDLPWWVELLTSENQEAAIVERWGAGAHFVKPAGWPVDPDDMTTEDMDEPAPAEPAKVAHQEEPKAFASPLLTRCPTCRAEPGHPCKNYKGQRCQTHADRTKASKVADQAQAAQVAKVCDEVAASFTLAVQDSRPVQADLFAAPECRKPTRPAPQATEPAPLFAKVSP
jgi:hypothetical protein